MKNICDNCIHNKGAAFMNCELYCYGVELIDEYAAVMECEDYEENSTGEEENGNNLPAL